MAVWIAFVSFAWDVAVSIYGSIKFGMLTPMERIFAGSGAIFAVGILVAGFLDREGQIKEVAELKQQLATGNSYLSGKLDVVAQVSQKIFETTAENARTNPQTPSIQAAASELESLNTVIANLKTEIRRSLPRVLSTEQRTLLKEAVNDILTTEPDFRVVLVHNWLDGEAQEYAKQFSAVLIPLNVSGVPISTQEVPADLEGLVIRFMNRGSGLPRRAFLFSEALTKAQILHTFEYRASANPNIRITDDYFDLAFGRKSSN